MIEVTEERKKLLKDDMQRLLKKKKKRLFLQDWIINLEMVDQSEVLGKWGENAFNWEGKWCNIRIAYPDEENQRKTIKYLPELTLVHELLHCKMNFLQPPDTYEGRYIDTCEHALLEELAKSLVMAKHGWTLEYFRNDEARGTK